MLPLSLETDENQERIYQLVKQIRHKSVVFFAGAALSMAYPSRIPLADKLKITVLNAIANRLPRADSHFTLISNERFIRRLRSLPLEVMFQIITNEIGDYTAEALAFIDAGSGQRAFNHNHLFLAYAAGRYFNVLFTTNFDSLIEDALSSLHKRHVTLVIDNEMANVDQVLSSHNISVVKLHGSVERRHTIIVTIDQAGADLAPNKTNLVSRCLRDFYVCFVGYGMGDYDIYSTLSSVSLVSHRGIYALLKPTYQGEGTQAYVQRNRRVLRMLEHMNGVPIVYDIDEFFNLLCATLFRTQHEGHLARSLRMGRPDDIVAPLEEVHIAQWSTKIRPHEAYSIIGALFYHLGEGEPSRTIYQRALELGIAADAREQFRLLLGRAYAYAREGQYQKCFLDANQALAIAKRNSLLFEVAEALYHSGDALRIRSDGLSLMGYLRLRAAQYQFAKIDGTAARHGRGSALLSLALVHRRICPPWRILRPVRGRILKQLEDAYALLGGPNGNAMRHIARLYAELGEYDQALTIGAQAEMICRWHEDNVGLANTMRTVGIIYLSLGDTNEARKAYLEALHASKRAPDKPGIAKALVSLARLSVNRGRYRRGLELYMISTRIIKEVGVRRFGSGFLFMAIWGILWCKSILPVQNWLQQARGINKLCGN